MNAPFEIRLAWHIDELRWLYDERCIWWKTGSWTFTQGHGDHFVGYA